MNDIQREALEFAGIGMYRYKFDGTIIFMDTGAMKLLELDDRFANPDDIAGKSIEDMIVYTGPKLLLRTKLREHGHLRDFIYPFKTLKGNEKWALHDSYITKDEASGEDHIQVIVKDITSQMLIWKALKESEERYQRLVDSAPDIIMRWSVDKGIEFVSQSVTTVTGYTPEEIMNDPEKVFAIASGNDPGLDVDYRTALDTGVTLPSRILTFPHKDGRKVRLEARMTPIKNDKGSIIAFEGILRDITEKEKAEKKILSAKRQAELYLDIMLHDITNFNQICIGNLDLIALRTKLDENQKPYIEKARRQLLKSESLIAKLRTIPELEDEDNAELIDIDLGKTIRSCIDVVVSLYPAAAGGMLFEHPGGVKVRGIDLLERAIFNVMENGIKHTSSETPEIRVDIHESKSGAEEFVEIRITDNGQGIPEDMRERIFERKVHSAKRKGLGLGLSLTKSIIERSGGEIRVENRVKGDAAEGSVFVIRLKRSGD